MALTAYGFCRSGEKAETITKANDNKVVVAYVTSWGDVIPDASLVTHINYAFGHVKDTFDGVRVDNPDRLREIVKLKEKNGNLKVLLSVGGWGSGNFSEMAASDSLRTLFAKDCARTVEEFGLDGIDIDWEYPTSKAAGISHSDNDTENFTLMMRDLREALGNDRLLTLASVNNARYVDFRSLLNTIDFVNIMAYDMNIKGSHHAPLYESELTAPHTAAHAVAAHIDSGVPPSQLVLGLPFYGKDRNDKSRRYKDIRLGEGEKFMWDSIAKIPYIVDSCGEYIFGFEDEKSIAAKADFIRKNGLRGAMYWEAGGDDSLMTLTKAVYYGVFPCALSLSD